MHALIALTAVYVVSILEIPGYEFRRLKNFTDEELWNAFAKGGEVRWQYMDERAGAGDPFCGIAIFW